VTDWDDLEQLLLELATDDLLADGEICPSLAAYRGQAPLLLGFLRSFDKGAYHDAVVELLALAMPLGADRLVFTAGARAWSWNDPLPPVVPGVGDLRQRVLAITFADGAAEDVESVSALHPFDLTGGGVRWGEVVRERGDGWLSQALTVALEHRDELSTGIDEAREQARRCAALGHKLAFSPAVADLLALHADQI
jgi:hypothetical protein